MSEETAWRVWLTGQGRIVSDRFTAPDETQAAELAALQYPGLVVMSVKPESLIRIHPDQPSPSPSSDTLRWKIDEPNHGHIDTQSCEGGCDAPQRQEGGSGLP